MSGTEHWTGSRWEGEPAKPFAYWSQEAIDLLLSERVGYLGVSTNSYGTPMAVFRCTVCGSPFGQVPITPGCEKYTVCGIPETCPGYDPSRDVMRMLASGEATLHSDSEDDS